MLEEIKFEEVPESFRLTDAFREISCIQLEITDESVIGMRLRKIIDAAGKIVVLSDNDILVFDRKNGKFLRTLGSCGEGPEEYKYVASIFYNHDKGTVVAYDRYSRELISYTLEGEFKGRETVDADIPFVLSIERSADGTMLTCNAITSEVPDECAFTIVRKDGGWSNIDPFAPVRQDNVIQFWASNPISVFGDDLKFVKFLTNKLYSIKAGHLAPVGKLDFGRKYLTKEMVVQIGDGIYDRECTEYCIKNKYFTSVDKMFETSRYIVIVPDIASEGGYYWIDKETGKNYHIDSTSEFAPEVRKVLQGKTIINMFGSGEDEIISCFEASFCSESFKKRFSENIEGVVFPESVMTAIANVDPDGNPFLIIYSH